MVKIPNREKCFTINQLIEIPCGTEMTKLFELGTKGLLEYVKSGFKKIPTRVVLRTDSKQVEIETLPQQEIENILNEVVDNEMMNESN